MPEERNGHAAVPDMTLAENAVLSGRQRMGLLAGGFIDAGKARELRRRRSSRSSTSARPGIDALARSLSGGNLQKFIVGREILQNPGVLVVSQPTWGVDAGRRGRDPSGPDRRSPRTARPSWSSRRTSTSC